MRKGILISMFLLFIILSGCSTSTSTQNYIDGNQINASIVISSLNTEKEYIINRERSEQRFLPASTFKIPNTLIALQEGVIKDENEMIKWDGKEKGLQEWNKDQSLKTAFPVSCVWFFQELAKKVELGKYSGYLSEMNYGNQKTGSSVETFWLEGDIRISAKEQIEFLKKVYNEEYDFDKKNYKILKDLMIEEKTAEYTLRGKTGWAQRIEPQIGWYVGYLETPEDTWFFACNVDINNNTDADYRKTLVLEYLKDLKIIK